MADPRGDMIERLWIAYVDQAVARQTVNAGHEIVSVICPDGHELKVAASKRKPECERYTFCPRCFVTVIKPLVMDESTWVDW